MRYILADDCFHFFKHAVGQNWNKNSSATAQKKTDLENSLQKPFATLIKTSDIQIPMFNFFLKEKVKIELCIK